MTTNDPRTANQIRGGYTVQHGKIILGTRHAGTSSMGNPSYWMSFTDGTIERTAPNSSIAYSAENPDQRGVPLTVVYTRAGLIAYWEPEH